jgi:hypothetical protein
MSQPVNAAPACESPQQEDMSGPPAANRHRLGASCYAAPGQRQFRLTIAGCRLIVGTSELGCIFQVSGLKVRGRSQLRSIAQDMCSTSIPRSKRPRSIKRDIGQRTSAWTLRGGDSLHSRRTTAESGGRSHLSRLAEEERTLRPASDGWTSAELCRRPWFSLQTYAEHSQKRLLPIQCCGASTESRRAPFGQVIPMEAP